MGLAILSLAVWAAQGAPRVTVAEGRLEGTMQDGVRSFLGVPFAAPPVGDLRWREPQPMPAWTIVRNAKSFGPRPMQRPTNSDQEFRSATFSEDCLYLNVWTPPDAKDLPILVYFFGGGFTTGSSDEGRYDGGPMAKKGVVAITVNYRLNVFGFLAHPELTAESPHHVSGNYGLMDQAAAIAWVRKNAAAFGGDPNKITIGGESAGSFAVSLMMASPIAREGLAGAIGESGATLTAPPLAQAEGNGVRFAQSINAPSLKALRAMHAHELQELARDTRFGVNVDGYVLPKAPEAIFAAGEQAKIPLLAGWNTGEGRANSVLGTDPATPEGFGKALARLYPGHEEAAKRAFPAMTDAEALAQATALAGDRFIGFNTWKWTDLHARTGGKPVYRYLFAHPRPGERTAVHSGEIEYALGNLNLRHYAWKPEDRALEATMLEYWTNFVKRGNPNASGLPAWPPVSGPSRSVMRLDVNSVAAPDTTLERYRFLDSVRP